MFSSDDHRYMAQALRLAEYGLYTTDPNPRVGCVIVRDDNVVGQGWHECAGEPHAEVHALNDAGEKAKDATAYVTLEPCSHHGRTPPCAEALIAAGVKKVICAMVDPSPKVAGRGIKMLQEAGIEAASGLMEAQARELNPGFIQRYENDRPYVRCKLAMSLDGRTALANGESKWITCDAARADVQKLRARSSAIITGIGTVLADDPRMNARVGEAVKQPDRIVLDSSLKMPIQSAMLSQEGNTWIATCSEDDDKRTALEHVGAKLMSLPRASGGVSLETLLKQLSQLQYNELLVEAGPVLSGAFLQAGLLDEIVVYMAPHIMGDGARGLFQLPILDDMQQRIALEIKDLRQVGTDIRLTLKADN